MNKEAVRRPAVAGVFYPGSSTQLKEEVRALLSGEGPTNIAGSLHALIAPHAGYMYSGRTAAIGFRLLKAQSFDVVIVVGPSHREYFAGISVYPGLAYETPLGRMRIDYDVREALRQAMPQLMISEEGHGLEHSIEVQLPFLQVVLGDIPFLPVVMGDQSRTHCSELAEALAKIVEGKRALLLASSDLSHYHDDATARTLDTMIVHDVEQFHPEALMTRLESKEVEACGGGPMVAVMLACKRRGANKSTILEYCTSGDVSGKKDSVVGYLSAAFSQVS